MVGDTMLVAPSISLGDPLRLWSLTGPCSVTQSGLNTAHVLCHICHACPEHAHGKGPFRFQNGSA
jgi:hypothetical protein